MIKAERRKELEEGIVEGIMFCYSDIRELLAEIDMLRGAMKDSMEDKNANPDSIGPLGRALGMKQNSWGDWVEVEADHAR